MNKAEEIIVKNFSFRTSEKFVGKSQRYCDLGAGKYASHGVRLIVQCRKH